MFFYLKKILPAPPPFYYRGRASRYKHRYRNMIDISVFLCDHCSEERDKNEKETEEEETEVSFLPYSLRQ